MQPIQLPVHPRPFAKRVTKNLMMKHLNYHFLFSSTTFQWTHPKP